MKNIIEIFKTKFRLLELFIIFGSMVICVSPASAKDKADAKTIELCMQADAKACFDAMLKNRSISDEIFPSRQFIRYGERACDLNYYQACSILGMTYFPSRMYGDDEINNVPNLDKSIYFLEKSCFNVTEFIDYSCYYLSNHFFNSDYRGISLEDAYIYGIDACSLPTTKNCIDLYNNYEKIQNLPKVEHKIGLFMRIYVADWYYQVILAPPLSDPY